MMGIKHPKTDREYQRRVELCVNAIRKAAKNANFSSCGEVAENYMGVEFPMGYKTINGLKVRTGVISGKVNVVFRTGYGPRFPKKVTLSVGAHIENNSRVRDNWVAGNCWQKNMKFHPDSITITLLARQLILAKNWVEQHLNEEYVRKLIAEKKRKGN